MFSIPEPPPVTIATLPFNDSMFTTTTQNAINNKTIKRQELIQSNNLLIFYIHEGL